MTNRTWLAAFAFTTACFQIAGFVLAVRLAPNSPLPGAAAADIRRYYTTHNIGVTLLNGLDVAGTLVLIAFVAALWLVLRSFGEENHKWARESIIATAAFVVVNVAADITQLMLAGKHLADAAMKLIFSLGFVLQSAAVFPLAILTIVLSSDLRRAAIVPDWTARWGIIAGIFLLIGELSIFFTDPGTLAIVQSFTLSGTFGFVLWLCAIGVATLMRRDSAAK